MSSLAYTEVLTGDLIQSRRLPVTVRKLLPARLAAGLSALSKPLGAGASPPPARAACYEVSRGDSFQIVLEGGGLRAALFLMAFLEHGQPPAAPLVPRLALGIGRAEYLELLPQGGWEPVPRGYQADGDAFMRSGDLLEELKRERRRVGVRSPWPEVDAEFRVACLFLDDVVRRWSTAQAAAVMMTLRGETQLRIARAHGVSQSAIAQRLRAAGIQAVEALLSRCDSLLAARAAGQTEPVV